jgi:glucosamine-6-phosphate deaminase
MFESTITAGKLSVHAFETCEEAGKAAAAHAAKRIRELTKQHGQVAIIFATGVSQLILLRCLVTLPDLAWDRVVGFHMDEYAGISDRHKASFRKYLREELAEKVPLQAFYGILGDAPNLEQECDRYAALLRAHQPQLCFLGIGENGHLAFNDPHEADFDDPKDVKVVELDHTSRHQQVNEGWFPSDADVPKRAITLTIPTLMRVPELIVSAPEMRKRAIVERTLNEPISTACPSTVLRSHPNAHLYVDAEAFPSSR